MLLRIVTVLFFVFCAYEIKQHATPSLPPEGIVAPNTPVQNDFSSKPVFHLKDYTIKALAHYDIEARVLLTDRYRFTLGADLAPIDLTVSWGRMSDSSVFSKLNISHGYRDYFWSISKVSDLPIPQDEINSSTANMHLIPANDEVKEILFSFKPYEVVQLHGYLVSVSGPNGFQWQSSLTRTDSGNGACELMWVESAY